MGDFGISLRGGSQASQGRSEVSRGAQGRSEVSRGACHGTLRGQQEVLEARDLKALAP